MAQASSSAVPPSAPASPVSNPNGSGNGGASEVNYQLSDHITKTWESYIKAGMQDLRLWKAFTWDFGKLKAQQWNSVTGVTRDYVESCCFINGLWIDEAESWGDSMVLLSLTKWTHRWSIGQINWVEDNYGEISHSVQFRKEELIDPNAAKSRRRTTIFQTMEPPGSPIVTADSDKQANSPKLTDTGPPKDTDEATPAAGGHALISPPSQPPTPDPNPEHTTKSKGTNPFGTPYSQELVQLGKTYTKDEKFTGTGDNFSFKLSIYYAKCKVVNLPPDDWINGAMFMLADGALNHFFTKQAQFSTWTDFSGKMKTYYEGDEWQRLNLTKWQTMNITDTIAANPTSSTTDCLRKMCSEMERVQRGLNDVFHGPIQLRENIIRACRDHVAFSTGLVNPPSDSTALINNLFNSITNYEAVHKPASYVQDEGDIEAYFTDRKFQRHDPKRGRAGPNRRFQRPKKCFVCGKEGCWSTNHSQQERDASKRKFSARFPQFRDRTGYDRTLQQYIVEIEGIFNDDDEITQYFEELLVDVPSIATETTDEPGPTDSAVFFTSIGKLQGSEAVKTTNMLADKSFMHRITMEDEAITPMPPNPFIFSTATDSRYDNTEFKGILIDSGAAARSTGGIGQWEALQRLDNSIRLDKTTAGLANFTFGIGTTSSIGTILLKTPIGLITFHIVPIYTPFLLCLADMDQLGAYFNNTTNQVIQNQPHAPHAPHGHPVIRRYGHAFLLWHTSAYIVAMDSFALNPCFLTEMELRRLHRRFGHPSVRRLHDILQQAQQEVDLRALEKLTKYCKHCQMHGRSPGRFSFTIRDEDIEFNYNVIVDILYITGKPVLHVVDEATRFQAGRWLKDISARHVWDQLRSCWIDTYLGPPDTVTADAGKQFMAKEFKQYAANMGITVRNAPVEAHHSIGMVERYHGPLRRVYTIICDEVPGIEPELALQMSFKALNDSVGPNGLVPTLLVFGAYPRMAESDAPSPTITQRAMAMRKAMDQVKKDIATRRVHDALNSRNGPSTDSIHDLPLNSPVLVFREGNATQSGAWKGPYKLLSMQGESAIIELPNGPTKFRSTSIKAYFDDPTPDPAGDDQTSSDQISPYGDDHGQGAAINARGQGPATNEVVSAQANQIGPPATPVKRGRGRPRKHSVDANLCFIMEHGMKDSSDTDELFLGEGDYSQPPQYTSSRQKEINGLLEKGVFKVVSHENVPEGIRIFNSRFVDEIKHPGTDMAYEKSRLVVQAYNDLNKDLVLTQSPTIQRVSQRLIICMAATLQNDHTKLYLRDITQAYVQSTSDLNRDFFIRPPVELIKLLNAPANCILKVMKPLYGVLEVGNHWFATYHAHHLDKLGMTESTYDPCLLFRTSPLEIVGMQTDDTLMLTDDQFATAEEDAIKSAKIMCKDRDQLTSQRPIKFNGAQIKLDHESGDILLTKETHVGGISLVTNRDAPSTSARGVTRPGLSPKDQYVAQRARGAYMASVCQPEASYDLSRAAQSINFTKEDVAALNKRLQWQVDNKSRGLRFVRLDQDSLQLIVFTDSSFANNKDLSSQIGFVICLADKSNRANILHWSSVKCKRVTRSVLAAELYAMAHGFDIGAVIKATLTKVMEPDAPLPLIICTDSKSLYDCLVRLGTTQEKRLMVDVMCLRQSYERREITEVRWINGDNNPADSMTKAKPTSALKDLINTNRVNLDATEWVERKGDSAI